MTVLFTAGNEGAEMSAGTVPSMSGLFFRVLISFILIILLLYGVLKLLKKQQEIRLQIQQDRKNWIKVYDYQELGTGKGVYLTEIMSKVCILGVTDNNVSLLKEIESEDETWQDIKDGLIDKRKENPKGIGGFFSTSLKEELEGQKNNVIDEQLQRTRRLFNRVKGGNGDEES